MPGQLVSDLIGQVQEEVSARRGRNRFVDLLEAGRVPRERLTWLAGEQFCVVGSDQRSFALLAARFPEPPAGEMFLSLAQAYPAYLGWSAVFGTCSGVALAMLANLQEWGSYCDRVAGALLARYGLAEPDVAFFRFFAAPPPGFTDQATSVVAAGLAAGEDPREAARAALALHAYELAFWDTLSDGLD